MRFPTLVLFAVATCPSLAFHSQGFAQSVPPRPINPGFRAPSGATGAGTYDALSVYLQQQSQAQNQKGQQTKVDGKAMGMGAFSLIMGATGIIGKGELKKKIGTWLMGNPITAPIGKVVYFMGEHYVVFGLMDIAKGTAQMATAIKTENRGDSQLSDAARIANRSLQSKDAADDRRVPTSDGLTGLLSNGGGGSDDFSKADANGDGELSSAELQALLPPEAVAKLAQYGQLESTLSQALGDGNLSAARNKLLNDENMTDLSFQRDMSREDLEMMESENARNILAYARENKLNLNDLGVPKDEFAQALGIDSIEISETSSDHGALSEDETQQSTTPTLTQVTNSEKTEEGSISQATAGDGTSDPPAPINLSGLFSLGKNSDKSAGLHSNKNGETGLSWGENRASAPSEAAQSRTPSSEALYMGLGTRMPDLFVTVMIRYSKEVRSTSIGAQE